MKDTLNAVALLTRGALKCHSVVLYSYDPETGEIGYPPTSSGIPEPMKDWPDPVLPKTSLVREMIRLVELYAIRSIPDTDNPVVRNAKFPQRHGIMSCAIVPLIVAQDRKEKVGVMFVNYGHKHQFGKDEMESIQFFADHAAIAIRDAQLAERLKMQLSSQVKVARLTQELLSQELLNAVGLQDMLDRAVTLATAAFNVSHSAIVLKDERSTS